MRLFGTEQQTSPEPASRLGGGTDLMVLAIGSILSSVFLGPVGAVMGLVVGWLAFRELRLRSARGLRAVAALGMALGGMLCIVWGGVLTYAVFRSHSTTEVTLAGAPGAIALGTLPDDSGPHAFSMPRLDSGPEPTHESDPTPARLPNETRVTREGAVTVVELGNDVVALADVLAKERAHASPLRQTILLMTTRESCGACRSIASALPDPRMQVALSGVRLVRVDADAFGEDLDELKIPHERFPGFFLLALDLKPRDGIDGAEWEEDIPSQIAPVLGAFVRGRYDRRKQPWHPPPGSGLEL